MKDHNFRALYIEGDPVKYKDLLKTCEEYPNIKPVCDMVSDNLDALCGCGNIGDVEGLVGGNAIGRRFSPLGYPDSATLFVAAKAGDTRAGALIDDLCRVMGRTLYNLIATLDLQRISIGGSVFWHHREWLLPKLRAEVVGKLPALTEGCELVPAGLGERVGDFGALALVA